MTPDEQYRAAPGLNWSKLRPYMTSPLHAKWEHENDKDTSSMLWGRLVHALVLEPKEAHTRYAVYDGRRGTKAHKEWQADHPGVQDVKPLEWRTAVMAANAVGSHNAARCALAQCETEIPLAWTCPQTGVDMKAKIDAANQRTKTLVDLKTARTINARRFGSHAAAMGYHGQLAHYSEAVTHALGWTPTRVVIVAVESSGPFDVAVFELDEHALAAGHAVRDACIKDHLACLDAQWWPGKYPTPMELMLPDWAYPSDETLDDLGLEF